MSSEPTDILTWQEYERRKKALSPDLSPKEYEDAIDQICEELGI